MRLPSSFFPILTAVFLLRNESLIYQYAGAVVSLIAIVSAFFLFLLVFVVRWDALLGSMQFFIMLPLSRYKIVAALVALPVFSFSPIALLPLVGIDLSYSVCWIVLSLALLNNAVHLKWDPVAAVFTLNLIGVLAGLSFAIQDYPDLSRLIFDHHLDWAFALAIMIGSIVWIHHLIHTSNAPYRHKPTFGAFS